MHIDLPMILDCFAALCNPGGDGRKKVIWIPNQRKNERIRSDPLRCKQSLKRKEISSTQ